MSDKPAGHPLYSGPHTSENLWRHQESSALHQKVGLPSQSLDDKNKRSTKNPGSPNLNSIIVVEKSIEQTSIREGSSNFSNGISLELKCGPLLNYRRMVNNTWFGSVLIVTNSHDHFEDVSHPSLNLAIHTAGCHKKHQSDINDEQIILENRIIGSRLYSDQEYIFWRFDLQVPMQKYEIRCHYNISDLINPGGEAFENICFYVPAISECMRIMFHSCNGFSIGTNINAFSGACLWNDVLRVHQKAPFHVMIGGGDQIYNDGIRVDGPLRKWADIKDPTEKRVFPFDNILREECDCYYANNYIDWYTTEPFASSNKQIAQINIWDDHDIIDGFGSYDENFMRCPVFKGIGEVANKYYLLFQHHLAPSDSTCYTDQQNSSYSKTACKPRPTGNTFMPEELDEPSYITGAKPGPYVMEYSRNIFTRLGSRIAFLGIDGRTERTRDQVNYHETYDRIFHRLENEFHESSLSLSPIRHLIILLGIPIAYPRLTWLEKILTSPIMAPVRFLNKKYNTAGSLFNQFDGSIDLLDDLDDHYTAKRHEKERFELIRRLQEIALRFSVRISILGGDVHLAAIGRFYSNPKLKIPISQDHRYMVNVISSAIVNKPPPKAVANIIAWSNKKHHLDKNTNETMMKLFDRGPGKEKITPRLNHITMPRRNWTMLTENPIPEKLSSTNSIQTGVADTVISTDQNQQIKNNFHRSWLHSGEIGAGTLHKAANIDQHGRGTDGSLDVCIRVEIDHHDVEGKTEQYGMTVPLLNILDKR